VASGQLREVPVAGGQQQRLVISAVSAGQQQVRALPAAGRQNLSLRGPVERVQRGRRTDHHDVGGSCCLQCRDEQTQPRHVKVVRIDQYLRGVNLHSVIMHQSGYPEWVPTFDAAAVDCRVAVFREGLLTSFGHDVTLRVTRLSLDVTEDDEITADFDPGSLRVTTDISDSDRKDIEKNAVKVLEPEKYPKIQFRSVSVVREGDRARVEGDLTLHGVTRLISAEAYDDGARWNATIVLDQREFGIKPFSAMLGALKVKPEVEVNISVPHPWPRDPEQP
jgi:YceI-like domain